MSESQIGRTETGITPEVSQAIETAKKLASPDFFSQGVNHQGRLVRPSDEYTDASLVNDRFIFIGTEEAGQEVPPTQFLDRLDGELPSFGGKISDEGKEKLINQGIIQEQNGQLIWGENVSPKTKLQVLASVMEEIKNNGLDNFCPRNIVGGDFLTGLQALALEYARQSYEGYQPSASQEEKEIVYKKRTRAGEDRFKISVAYSVGGESPKIAVEREMIFKVDERKKIRVGNESLTFGDLLGQIETIENNGDLSQLAKIPEKFAQVLEQNPQEAAAIVSRLKKEMAMRLTSPSLSDEDKQQLQALLGIPPDSFNQESFNQALKTLFKLDSLIGPMQSSNKQEQDKAFEEYYRQIYELGAVIFGTEGLQRLVEVDLRSAVAFSDILLPPEVRLARIQLEQQLAEAKKTAREQVEDERLREVLGKLALADENYQKLNSQLNQLRQTQREAILYAFGVKFKDGRPVIANPSDEVKQLAVKIKEQYDKMMETGQVGILEANRQMVLELLQTQGVGLSEEQKNALFTALSNKGRKSTDEIIRQLGIDENHPSFSLLRAIIADGNRVKNAVCGLGRRVVDSYSQVEDLTIEGDILSMGLKGVEYLYRHGKFNEEEIKAKVVIPGRPGEKPPLELPGQVSLYETVQGAATRRRIEAEAEAVIAEPEEPAQAEAEVPSEAQAEVKAGELEEVETLEQRLNRMTNVNQNVIESDERKKQKLREIIQQERPENVRRSLERLQKELGDAKEQLASFDETTISSLASEIYARGVGQKSWREADQMRKLGETRVVLRTNDGQLIDITEELTKMEFEGEKPSGERSKFKLSKEAILQSPELAKELMGEVLLRRLYESLVSSLEQAVKAKKQIEAQRLAEKNLAALEEKTHLRELLSGLKEEKERETAQRDLDKVKAVLGDDEKAFALAQEVLGKLHRRGAFRRDINRFNQIAEKLANQLEQQAGWNPETHGANVEAVKRALLYYAAATPPAAQSPAPTEPPAEEAAPSAAEPETPVEKSEELQAQAAVAEEEELQRKAQTEFGISPPTTEELRRRREEMRKAVVQSLKKAGAAVKKAVGGVGEKAQEVAAKMRKESNDKFPPKPQRRNNVI